MSGMSPQLVANQYLRHSPPCNFKGEYDEIRTRGGSSRVFGGLFVSVCNRHRHRTMRVFGGKPARRRGSLGVLRVPQSGGARRQQRAGSERVDPNQFARLQGRGWKSSRYLEVASKALLTSVPTKLYNKIAGNSVSWMVSGAASGYSCRQLPKTWCRIERLVEPQRNLHRPFEGNLNAYWICDGAACWRFDGLLICERSSGGGMRQAKGRIAGKCGWRAVLRVPHQQDFGRCQRIGSRRNFESLSVDLRLGATAKRAPRSGRGTTCCARTGGIAGSKISGSAQRATGNKQSSLRQSGGEGFFVSARNSLPHGEGLGMGAHR